MEALHERNLFGNGIDAVANSTLCEKCGKPFEPRSGSGGKPQRFCSTECRQGFHANKPQRSQRSPTCSESNTLAAVEQPSEKRAPEPTPEGDSSDWCWFVPEQARIECAATNDDTIEIEQISPLDESENQRIIITRGNAVRLARSILYAAGFKGILIATGVNGGWNDVEDGDLPEQFDA